jgi:hypothetical protein
MDSGELFCRYPRLFHMADAAAWPTIERLGLHSVTPMVPELREILLEHRAEHPYALSDPVFPTSNGTRNTTHDIRRHVIDPVRARAKSCSLRRTGRRSGG